MKSQWVNKGTSEEGFEWTGGATVERGTGFPLEAVIGEPNFKGISERICPSAKGKRARP